MFVVVSDLLLKEEECVEDESEKARKTGKAKF